MANCNSILSSGPHEVQECVHGEPEGSQIDEDADDEEFAQELMRELTSEQLAILRGLHAKEDGDESFRDWMEGWQHEAAEDGQPLSSFLDTYVLTGGAQYPDEPTHPDATEDCRSAHNPFFGQLVDRQPSLGWCGLRAVLSQLSRTQSMSVARLRHHLPDTVAVENLLALADEFPVLVRRTTGRAPSLALVWPQNHDSRCPRIGLSRRSTHARKCICGLLAVSALSNTRVHSSWLNWEVDPESAPVAGEVELEGDEQEESEDEAADGEGEAALQWWDAGERGLGCDAAALASLSGW